MTSPNRQQGLLPDAIHQQQWTKIGSPDRLARARTFLGYCRRVVIDLGTEKPLAYYRNIAFSGAQDEHHGLTFGAPSTVTAGTGGLPFNIGITVPITQPRALSQNVDAQGDYLEVLRLAKDRPIIIYDTHDQSARGWMVPSLCVILHMIHIWSANAGATFSQNPP